MVCILVSGLEQTCCTAQLIYVKQPHSVLAPWLSCHCTSYSTSSSLLLKLCFRFLFLCFLLLFLLCVCLLFLLLFNPAVRTTRPHHWSAAGHGWLTEPSIAQPVHYAAPIASVDGSMPRNRTACKTVEPSPGPWCCLDVPNFCRKKTRILRALQRQMLAAIPRS